MRSRARESPFFSLVRVGANMLVLALPCADRYPYVSHLVCNAGVAPFMGLSWSLLLRQLWRNLLDLNIFGFMVYPSYVVQRKGIMSDDGLGWTWQCNVFGHYILVRALSYFSSERN